MARRRSEANGPQRTARFGVYLDEQTRTALLRVALDEGTSATELVERLVRDYLAKHRRRRKPETR